MVVFWIILILVGCPGFLLAETEVSGEVSGVWDADGSPYIVVDSTWVPEGEELRIDPGVHVEFTSHGFIELLGTLTANGTEDDSIFFQGHDHEGFIFNEQEYPAIPHEYPKAVSDCESALSHFLKKLIYKIHLCSL